MKGKPNPFRMLLIAVITAAVITGSLLLGKSGLFGFIGGSP